MCYPCHNCGACEKDGMERAMRCPRCGTVLEPGRAACAGCGWRVPLPPGQGVARPRAAAPALPQGTRA